MTGHEPHRTAEESPASAGRGRPLPDPRPHRSTTWLYAVVFLAGAALMAYEIVGSRLLAPFFGSSTYVWGSLIGVFLAALALGYSVGGRIADRAPRAGALALVLIAAALLVAISSFAAEPAQRWLTGAELGVRLTPLLASIVLFGPASILMGMVSPWAVRLRAGNLETVGRTAGSLYGLSTAGSIVGTIASSFWLVQALGSDATVLAVACTLAVCACVTAVAGRAHALAVGFTAVCVVAFGVLALAGATERVDGDRVAAGSSSDFSPVFHAGGYRPEFTPSKSGRLRAQTDTSYHRIRVVDYPAGQLLDERVRVLHFDNSLQAATRIDGAAHAQTAGPPVFGYLRAFELVPAIKPDADRMLLVGLGSGAAAMRLHELRPKLRIDVVELDPEVVTLARRWFGYRDSERGVPQIHTHVGDGRTWLASQPDDVRFDAVVLDTYFSDSIPFHLTTREFLRLVRSHLADDGVAAANLIGAVEGDKSELLRSMHRTWSDVFDDTAVYPVPNASGAADLTSFGNVELLAAPRRGTLPSRGGDRVLLETARFAVPTDDVLDERMLLLLEARYAGTISHRGVPVLTDDRAPVDALLDVEGI